MTQVESFQPALADAVWSRDKLPPPNSIQNCNTFNKEYTGGYFKPQNLGYIVLQP